MNNLIMPYNYWLPKWLKTWTHYDYSGITFVLADSYGLLNHMVYYPQKFGFKDVKHPCCGQDVDGELECPPPLLSVATEMNISSLMVHIPAKCANATICTVIE
ncbi:unnamed protein product [Camellia sinensis]